MFGVDSRIPLPPLTSIPLHLRIANQTCADPPLLISSVVQAHLGHNAGRLFFRRFRLCAQTLGEVILLLCRVKVAYELMAGFMSTTKITTVPNLFKAFILLRINLKLNPAITRG